MARIYEYTLKCGCLVSSDGGGGLIPCSFDGDNECDFSNWIKTKEGKRHLKELKERNSDE